MCSLLCSDEEYKGDCFPILQGSHYQGKSRDVKNNGVGGSIKRFSGSFRIFKDNQAVGFLDSTLDIASIPQTLKKTHDSNSISGNGRRGEERSNIGAWGMLEAPLTEFNKNGCYDVAKL